jgi:hypothetical protein
MMPGEAFAGIVLSMDGLMHQFKNDSVVPA